MALIRVLLFTRGHAVSSAAHCWGKALAYAVAQLPHLEPCFIDGQIEFDNNLTENAVRPTKLGHKNWMFIGGEHTGWRSAVIYTFVEQVRRQSADPFAYFEWVFEKLMQNPLSEELENLLPLTYDRRLGPCSCDTNHDELPSKGYHGVNQRFIPSPIFVKIVVNCSLG